MGGEVPPLLVLLWYFVVLLDGILFYMLKTAQMELPYCSIFQWRQFTHSDVNRSVMYVSVLLSPQPGEQAGRKDYYMRSKHGWAWTQKKMAANVVEWSMLLDSSLANWLKFIAL